MNKILLTIMACTALIWPTVSFAEEGHNHDHGKEHSSQTEHLDSDHHKGHDHGKEDGSEKDHEGHEHDEEHGAKEDHDGHDHAEHGDEHDEGFVEIPEKKAEKAGITTSKVIKGNLDQTLVLPGEVTINGDLLVHVAPRFEGTIKKVAKHVGEDVKKGDLLATVQSNESLAIYEIKAETDGIVIDKDASQGEFATNDKVLFTIANFDTVWVNAAVHTNDLVSVKKGLTATVRSKTTNTTQTGTIHYVRPTLNENTRTALARIVLDNPNRKWLPGMFVNVSLNRSSSHSNLLIPSESAVFVENEYVAFVKATAPDGGQGFEKRDITIGQNNGEQVEVLSGLKLGETVASGETFILKAELGKGSAEHSH